MRLRVVTYNVRSFRAGVRLAVDAIDDVEPDLVMVQEYGPPSRLRAFAGALAMDVTSSYRLFNRMRNAVLFRAPWRLGESTIGTLTKRRGEYQRGFVSARLTRPEASVTAISTHLGLSSRERPMQAEEILQRLPAGPLILAGDLNDVVDSPAVARLTGALIDCQAAAEDPSSPTFPARAPDTRIDYILVNDAFRPISCRVGSSEAAAHASDHLPVIAEVELLPRPGSLG